LFVVGGWEILYILPLFDRNLGRYHCQNVRAIKQTQAVNIYITPMTTAYSESQPAKYETTVK